MREFLEKKFEKFLGIDIDEIINTRCANCEGRIDSKHCDRGCIDDLISRPKNTRLSDVIISLFMTLAVTLGTAYMVKTNYSDQISNLFVFCVLYFVAMFVLIFGIRCFFSAIFNREED